MTLSAPYNFVPLSKHVCPAAALGVEGLPSQDKPEEGGSLSGSIILTLTAYTPILVSGGTGKKGDDATTNDKKFLCTPDATPATPAIPGSTLRGAVRNVMEVACFGQMALVDKDHVTSVRDLNNTARLDYGSKFTKTHGRNDYEAVSCAGWLQLVGGETTLTPCEFARIDHDELNKIALIGFKKNIKDKVRRFKNDRKPSPDDDVTNAKNVEGAFGASKGQTDIWVQGSVALHAHTDKTLRYHRAGLTQGEAERATGVGATQQDGTLVFTGIPSDTKHMEFFFYTKRGTTQAVQPVDKGVWARFIAVHENQEKPSPAWKWRKAEFDKGEPIPVFYLREGNGKTTDIGLAMMFKLAGENNIEAMIGHTSDDHNSGKLLDLPTRIFGRIENPKAKPNEGREGFRTRVSFGWAMATPDTFKEDAAKTVHLSKPKPGFAPAYVRQRDFADTGGATLMQGAQYRSYMNWPKAAAKDEIRGWKRYPVGSERVVTCAPDSTTSTLVPLVGSNDETNPEFTATIRYHNLHPVELGSLIWALHWGGDAKLRHAIGMGRPFGWGQVGIEIAMRDEQKAAAAAFVVAMEAWAVAKSIPGGWEKSVQIRQLRAMADPVIGNKQKAVLRQMVLNPDERINHFADAKAISLRKRDPLSGEMVTTPKLAEILPEYALATVAHTIRGHLSIGEFKAERLDPREKAVLDARRASIKAVNGRIGALNLPPPALPTDRAPGADVTGQPQVVMEVRFPVGSEAIFEGRRYKVVAQEGGYRWLQPVAGGRLIKKNVKNLGTPT